MAERLADPLGVIVAGPTSFANEEVPDGWAGQRPDQVAGILDGQTRTQGPEFFKPAGRHPGADQVLPLDGLDVGGELGVRADGTRLSEYDQLLPHVSCFVTNGGYTGGTPALHHGVPLVQAGVSSINALRHAVGPVLFEAKTSIPFMPTLPPFVLGAALLRARTAAAVPSQPLWSPLLTV